MDIKWAIPGQIATGSLPKSEDDVRAIVAAGFKAVISLHPPHWMVCQMIKDAGLTHYHADMPDQTSPGFAQMDRLSEMLSTLKTERKPVFVHCYLGIGRCRTVAAAFLARQLDSDEEALKRTGYPEQGSQVAFVRDYFKKR